MPTLCGLRRRVTPKSIRSFIEQIGVSKVNSIVEYGFLEHCLRDDLNRSGRAYNVRLKPVKLVITNYPEGQSPKNLRLRTTRTVPRTAQERLLSAVSFHWRNRLYGRTRKSISVLSRQRGKNQVCIHRKMQAAKGWKRQCCWGLCEYDPETKGGNTPDGRKVEAQSIGLTLTTVLDAK